LALRLLAEEKHQFAIRSVQAAHSRSALCGEQGLVEGCGKPLEDEVHQHLETIDASYEEESQVHACHWLYEL